VPRRRLNRREALGLGAAALAAGSLRPRPALAAAAAGHSGLFELEVREGAVAAGGWRVTAPLRAPRRFDLVGLGWERGAVEAQVRARRAGGSWTGWLALPALGDHGPDAGEGRARLGTEPAWTGAADLVQLRLRGRAEGLRARFVRTAPSAGVARALRGVRAQAAQLPPVIPRAAWGGHLVPPREPPSFGTVQLAFVHHTGPPARDYGPADSAAMVLAFASRW